MGLDSSGRVIGPTQYLYLTTHNTLKRETSMHAAGFEPTISTGERPQTYTLDRAAAGIVEEENCRIMFTQATNMIFGISIPFFPKQD